MYCIYFLLGQAMMSTTRDRYVQRHICQPLVDCLMVLRLDVVAQQEVVVLHAHHCHEGGVDNPWVPRAVVNHLKSERQEHCHYFRTRPNAGAHWI